jgi:hypothetical protein
MNAGRRAQAYPLDNALDVSKRIAERLAEQRGCTHFAPVGVKLCRRPCNPLGSFLSDEQV